MRNSVSTFGAVHKSATRRIGSSRASTAITRPAPVVLTPPAAGRADVRPRASRPAGDRLLNVLLQVLLAELQHPPDVVAGLGERRDATVLVDGLLAGIVGRERKRHVAAIAVEQHPQMLHA